jgi:hypothetical protein
MQYSNPHATLYSATHYHCHYCAALAGTSGAIITESSIDVQSDIASIRNQPLRSALIIT